MALRTRGKRIKKIRKDRIARLNRAHVLAYDEFNVPDGFTVAGRAPFVQPGSATWAVRLGAWAIAGRKLRSDHSSAAACHVTVDSGESDVLTRATFTLPATGTNRGAAVFARYVDNNNFIYAQAHMDVSEFRLVRRVAGGTFDTIDTEAATLSAGVPYTLEVIAVGDTITATLRDRDGALVTDALGATETSHNDATAQGVRANNSAGAGAIVIHDFRVENAATVYAQNAHTVAGVSRFVPGVTMVNNPHIWSEDGWDNAKAALGDSLGIFNLQLSPFGNKDPWTLTDPEGWTPGDDPEPAEPNQLVGTQASHFTTALDKLREISASAPIMLTLYVAGPWWMKGRLQTDGSTIPLTYPDDQFTSQGRIMTQYLPHWQILVKAACRLAMAAPYNVRLFQVWNEFKGYYDTRLNEAQKWEWDYYAGTAGLNADHGFAWLYKLTVDAILETATESGIAHDDIKIAAPYAFIRSQGANNANVVSAGHPLRDGAWGGSVIKMGLESMEGVHDLIVANGLKMDALNVDFGPSNNDDVFPVTDQWLIRTKADALMEYFRDEATRIGKPGLEIWGAEIYAGLGGGADKDTADPDLYTAVKADWYRRLLLGGMTYPLAWGPEFTADDANNVGAWMINDPSTSEGGTILPWGTVNKWFRDYFAPGVKLYDVTFSASGISGVLGLQPDGRTQTLLVINQEDAAKTLQWRDRQYSIGAYGVNVIHGETLLETT